MIDVVLRVRFLVQGGDRIGHKIHVDDIDLVGRPEGQNRQARQKHERLEPYRIAWSRA